MIIGRLFNKIINIFTGLFAIVTLLMMLLCYLDSAIGGLIPIDAMQTIGRIRNYCTLATIFCAGIEFTLKRNIIFAAVFALIVVAVACFMIYTDVVV